MSWSHWTEDGELANNVNTSNITSAETVHQNNDDLTFGPAREPGNENFLSDGHQAHVAEGFSGSVLGSAKDAGGGMIVNRSVTANDRVTLPEGMQTSAAVAANLGYLTRNPDGTFSDVEGLSHADGDEGDDDYDDDDIPDDDNDDEGGFQLSDEGQEALSKIANSVPAGTSIQAMDQLLTHGDVNENTLAHMASTASVEPHQMMEYIEATHQAFYDAASTHLEGLGVTDGEAFAAFVNEHPEFHQKVTNGARALVMHSDTAGLSEVAQAFMLKADEYMPSDVMEALDEAGYDYERNTAGKLLITIDGMQVPWDVAVRQQLIELEGVR